MKLPICEKLWNLQYEKRIPFHMPGHKRKCFGSDKRRDGESIRTGNHGPSPGEKVVGEILSMDITEITGYDDLNHPAGMILESMNMLSEIFRSRKSWYLINGSTQGILTAVSAVCQPGDTIIIARNCHKSVYNAVRLLHLQPLFLYPDYMEEYDMFRGIGKKQEKDLRGMLDRHENVKAVVVTSPTYEGIVSDIGFIKDILRPYGIPLIVDEAHGAHFIFHDYFPESAVTRGADIVVQSVHKTLPCVTQTAVLHRCSDLVSEESIREMLSVYGTSSPSYLLLASAEYGVFNTYAHREFMQEYVDNLIKFREKCGKLSRIQLLDPEKAGGFDYDRSKLVFLVKGTGLDGNDLFRKLLEDYHIECEMAAGFYCIAMTSLNDTQEEFQALENALFSIDQEILSREKSSLTTLHDISSEDSFSEEKKEASFCAATRLFSGKPEQAIPLWKAVSGAKTDISLEESIGEIAAEYIYLYPPGIPVLVPGEKITKEVVENLNYYLYNGYNVPALSEGRIRVVQWLRSSSG